MVLSNTIQAGHRAVTTAHKQLIYTTHIEKHLATEELQQQKNGVPKSQGETLGFLEREKFYCPHHSNNIYLSLSLRHTHAHMCVCAHTPTYILKLCMTRKSKLHLSSAKHLYGQLVLDFTCCAWKKTKSVLIGFSSSCVLPIRSIITYKSQTPSAPLIYLKTGFSM